MASLSHPPTKDRLAGIPLVEQVRYSSYGVPYGLPAGDTDSDGDFDSADVSAITGAYDVRKDANLDGTIDVFDVLHASNMAGGGGTVTTGRDVLGSPDNANRFGYGAYLRDPAVPQWHVRNRVLRSDIGRWLTRDPAGYVDGLSLYEYVGSSAGMYLDPLGLQAQTTTPIVPDRNPPQLPTGPHTPGGATPGKVAGITKLADDLAGLADFIYTCYNHNDARTQIEECIGRGHYPVPVINRRNRVRVDCYGSAQEAQKAILSEIQKYAKVV